MQSVRDVDVGVDVVSALPTEEWLSRILDPPTLFTPSLERPAFLNVPAVSLYR